MDDGSNASADTPTKRGLRSYEHTKVLAHFATEPLISQLHEIFPEWIAPEDSDKVRLLGLARAALAVSSAPHHYFALNCLREHVRRDGDAKPLAVECDENLL